MSGPVVTVANVADHVEHVAKVAGYDHVGIGADLDGIPFTPTGLEGVQSFPLLFAELIRRGFPYQDRDGRLIPGDIGRQTAWWFTQGLVKAPIKDKDIVDETFLREALKGMK